MLKIRNLIYIIIVIIIFNLISCVKPGIEIQDTICPQKKIECKPIIWTGNSIDTSQIKSNFKFRIERVNYFNSKADEWQLSKLKDKYFLTYSDKSLNRLIELKKSNLKEFIIKSGLPLPTNTHYGSICGYSNIGLIALSNTISNSNEEIEIDKSFGNCRIYEIEYSNYFLQNIKEIQIEAKKSDWIGHPSVFPNSKIIFFSSDMDGGYGGNDIWYIYKDKNGNWSKPINCGRNINTECDEVTPFISIDGNKLLFSSAGHSTIGGYDIFQSKISENFFNDFAKDENFFSVAENIMPPINTIYDEIFPFSDTDIDSVLYYSSNQQDNNFDIYVFYKDNLEKQLKDNQITKNKKEDKSNKDIEKVNISGLVVEKQTKNPISNAQIDIVDIPQNNEKQKLLTNEIGKFSTQLIKNKDYQLTAHKAEFFYDTKKISADSNITEIIFELPKIGEIRINFPFDDYQNPYKYTLDSNGIETGRNWQDELDLVVDNIKLSLNRIDKVILVGHTDDIGSVEYNNNLGERRVNFVINELVQRGIPRQLLYGRSAGKLEPLSKKENEDIDTYRKRLRRVTIEKILLR